MWLWLLWALRCASLRPSEENQMYAKNLLEEAMQLSSAPKLTTVGPWRNFKSSTMTTWFDSWFGMGRLGIWYLYVRLVELKPVFVIAQCTTVPLHRQQGPSHVRDTAERSERDLEAAQTLLRLANGDTRLADLARRSSVISQLLVLLFCANSLPLQTVTVTIMTWCCGMCSV